MDYLRKHKPVSDIFGKETHSGVGVELCIGEDPENDEKDTGNSLCCHEMGCVGLDISFLG